MQQQPTVTLRVANVPTYTPAEEFQRIFSQLHGCVGCRLVAEGNLQVGYADFTDSKAAQAAKSIYHGWQGWGPQGLAIDILEHQDRPVKRPRDGYGDGYGQTAFDAGGQQYNPQARGSEPVYGAQQQSVVQPVPGAQGTVLVGSGVLQNTSVAGAPAAQPQQLPIGAPAASVPASNPLGAILAGLSQSQLGTLASLLNQAQSNLQPAGQPASSTGLLSVPSLSQAQPQLQALPQQQPLTMLTNHTGGQLYQPAQVQSNTQVAQQPMLQQPAAAQPALIIQPPLSQQLQQQAQPQPPPQTGLLQLQQQLQQPQQPQPQFQQPAMQQQQPVLQFQQPQFQPQAQPPALQQPHQSLSQQPQQYVLHQQVQSVPHISLAQPQQLGLANVPTDGAATLASIMGTQAQVPVTNPQPVLQGRPLPENATSTLYMEGLPHDTTKREMAHIFRPFVGYEDMRVVIKETRLGERKVRVFVDFQDAQQAAAAMDALQGYKLDLDYPDTTPLLRIEFGRPPKDPSKVNHGDRFAPIDRGERDPGSRPAQPNQPHQNGMPPHLQQHTGPLAEPMRPGSGTYMDGGPAGPMPGPMDMRGVPEIRGGIDMRGLPDMRGQSDSRGPSMDIRGPRLDLRGPPDDMRGHPMDLRPQPIETRGPPVDMRGPLGPGPVSPHALHGPSPHHMVDRFGPHGMHGGPVAMGRLAPANGGAGPGHVMERGGRGRDAGRGRGRSEGRGGRGGRGW